MTQGVTVRVYRQTENDTYNFTIRTEDDPRVVADWLKLMTAGSQYKASKIIREGV